MPAPNAPQVLTNQLLTTPSLSVIVGASHQSDLSVASPLGTANPSRTPKPPSRSTDQNRRCVATGELREKHQLLRFVVSPDKELTFDVRNKLPGRGMWLTPSIQAFSIARKKNSFSRAAKQKISIPANLESKTAEILREHTLALLGLARRRGELVLGTAKVEAAYKSGDLSTLWLAIDASEATTEQWTQKVKGSLSQIRFFTRTELAVVLGRAEVVVMGLKHLGHKKADSIRGYVDQKIAFSLPILGPGWSQLSCHLQHLANLSDFLALSKQEYPAGTD